MIACLCRYVMIAGTLWTGSQMRSFAFHLKRPSVNSSAVLAVLNFLLTPRMADAIDRQRNQVDAAIRLYPRTKSAHKTCLTNQHSRFKPVMDSPLAPTQASKHVTAAAFSPLLAHLRAHLTC